MKNPPLTEVSPLIFGFIALPFEVYLWRLVSLCVVLVIGFITNALRLIGGGDAKFAAAIAPFFAASDIREILFLFSATMLAAFVTHRLFAKIGVIRAQTTDWVSWQAGNKFPMGFPLSGTLIFYLAISAFIA